ncbi:hypothetical protein BGW37DRAFT_430192 [Umbelopsis sp. PMI_123]|nr:hypothetical protein BGW37DRAFT_430192 [Umbelopsis sp. PMI_123]
MPVTYSGWLLKHNATHFTFTTPWKRYYYVLSEHILHEYKTDKPDSPHREQLDLSGDTLVFINEGFPGKPFVVEIRKPGHRMCLQCTDLETMKQWMYHLKKSIAQVRRNEYLKAVAEETHTRSTPPNHSSTDIVLSSKSPLSQSSNKSVAIPPQRPPPSHSPPPIPNM